MKVFVKLTDHGHDYFDLNLEDLMKHLQEEVPNMTGVTITTVWQKTQSWEIEKLRSVALRSQSGTSVKIFDRGHIRFSGDRRSFNDPGESKTAAASAVRWFLLQVGNTLLGYSAPDDPHSFYDIKEYFEVVEYDCGDEDKEWYLY